MNDLSEQLKNYSPDHQPLNEPEQVDETPHELYVQKEPMICQYEKRKAENQPPLFQVMKHRGRF